MAKRYEKTDRHFWRNLTTRFILVLIPVTIIVWVLPRTEGRMFHYDEGKPWMYGQLIAKFDFPIFKNEATLIAERDSVTRLFQPYYYRNNDIGAQQVERFRANFKNGLNDLPDTYVELIANRLEQLYQRGIMDPTEYNKISKDTTLQMRIVEGKQVNPTVPRTFLSTLTAYEQLFQNEELVKQRQALQRYNLNEYIEPNIKYDKERSETELNDQLSLIPQASGMVLDGQRIIERGDIVDHHTFLVLNSFEKAMEQRNSSEDEIISTIVGQTLYVLILILLFMTYLTRYHAEYFKRTRSLTMLFSMIVIFPVLVSLMMEFNKFSVYLIPFALAPIFIRVFTDSRTAFNTHVTMILICAVAVKYQYEFIIVQIVAGLIAIYSLRALEKRSQIFLTALLVTLGSAAVYLALQLIQSDDVSKLDQTIYWHFAANGFFLLFAYPLMLIIEKTFGFTSTVTLFELSNSNNKLLRQLSEVAPGTFQHSITVGNLAAEIAHRIGANGQLIRTGALYHDIGKMENPVFFTENQAGVNPHQQLNDIESAKIIISHVTDGLKLAENYNLPGIIKEFITTHHGEGLAKYFYVNYKNEHPDEEIDETLFRYPGPNPSSREQAILMMCDSVEAASRSLKEYTEETISTLVNRIIDTQVNDGFFTDCPITFHDISQAKQTLIERLMSMYHTRIEYPEERK
ncbi:MAG: HDIG domain-containing protein [Prevotella sp.]|nr:HDIG domain-containing protein [Prevotella sp.]